MQSPRPLSVRPPVKGGWCRGQGRGGALPPLRRRAPLHVRRTARTPPSGRGPCAARPRRGDAPPAEGRGAGAAAGRRTRRGGRPAGPKRAARGGGLPGAAALAHAENGRQGGGLPGGLSAPRRAAQKAANDNRGSPPRSKAERAGGGRPPRRRMTSREQSAGRPRAGRPQGTRRMPRPIPKGRQRWPRAGRPPGTRVPADATICRLQGWRPPRYRARPHLLRRAPRRRYAAPGCTAGRGEFPPLMRPTDYGGSGDQATWRGFHPNGPLPSGPPNSPT